MVDFKILEDIPHYGENDTKVERRYTCAAMGLFYVKSTEDIVPIAIQLHQVPTETNPIWTANDSELDWTYAKMWLKNADSQWHQVMAFTGTSHNALLHRSLSLFDKFCIHDKNHAEKYNVVFFCSFSF